MWRRNLYHPTSVFGARPREFLEKDLRRWIWQRLVLKKCEEEVVDELFSTESFAAICVAGC